MFLASPWLEIDVQTGHFAEFEQFIIDSHFFDFEKVMIDPIRLFLLTLGRSQLFYWVWEGR